MPDYVVVEGPMAGGHLGFGEDWAEHDLATIVREVKAYLAEKNLNIPVFAAGGVFSGDDAVNMIENVGADGVQVATRFTITKESGLPEVAKYAYLDAKEEDIEVNRITGVMLTVTRFRYKIFVFRSNGIVIKLCLFCGVAISA